MCLHVAQEVTLYTNRGVGGVTYPACPEPSAGSHTGGNHTAGMLWVLVVFFMLHFEVFFENAPGTSHQVVVGAC